MPRRGIEHPISGIKSRGRDQLIYMHFNNHENLKYLNSAKLFKILFKKMVVLCWLGRGRARWAQKKGEKERKSKSQQRESNPEHLFVN